MFVHICTDSLLTSTTRKLVLIRLEKLSIPSSSAIRWLPLQHLRTARSQNKHDRASTEVERHSTRRWKLHRLCDPVRTVHNIVHSIQINIYICYIYSKTNFTRARAEITCIFTSHPLRCSICGAHTPVQLMSAFMCAYFVCVAQLLFIVFADFVAMPPSPNRT